MHTFLSSSLLLFLPSSFQVFQYIVAFFLASFPAFLPNSLLLLLRSFLLSSLQQNLPSSFLLFLPTYFRGSYLLFLQVFCQRSLLPLVKFLAYVLPPSLTFFPNSLLLFCILAYLFSCVLTFLPSSLP